MQIRDLRRYLTSPPGRLARVGLLVFLIGAAPPAVASADIEEMVLHVRGLACPFCAYRLEKKVVRIDGVEGLDIQMDEGRVVLTLAPAALVSLDQLGAAVADAGFSLAGVEVTATGTLVTRDGESRLEWGDGASAVLDWHGSEQFEQLRAQAEGTEVRVSGRVRPSEPGPALFVIDVATYERVS